MKGEKEGKKKGNINRYTDIGKYLVFFEWLKG